MPKYVFTKLFYFPWLVGAIVGVVVLVLLAVVIYRMCCASGDDSSGETVQCYLCLREEGIPEEDWAEHRVECMERMKGKWAELKAVEHFICPGCHGKMKILPK